MTIVRWMLGGCFIALFAYITVVQLAYIVAFQMKKTTKHSSLVPVCILGLVGLIILPDPLILQKWFWVPFVFDPFLYMVVFGLPVAIIRNLTGK